MYHLLSNCYVTKHCFGDNWTLLRIRDLRAECWVNYTPQFMAMIVLDTLHKLCNFIFLKIIWGTYFYLHFTDEEMLSVKWLAQIHTSSRVGDSSRVSLTPKAVLLNTCPGFGLLRAIKILSTVQTAPGAREHHEQDCTELRQGGQGLNQDYLGHWTNQ